MTAADRQVPMRRKGSSADRPRRSSPSKRAPNAPLPTASTTAVREVDDRRVPRFGALVVARKEFADLINSVRFFALLLILGFAALLPLIVVGETIRSAATISSQVDALTLYLLLAQPTDSPIFSTATFITLIGPVLGIAFAFDAINGERAGGTLSRLVAQPIYRDDVINGKFLAGLAAIALALAVIVGVIVAYGMFRLGLTPAWGEIVRLFAWYVTTLLYIGFWLVLGLLLSVAIRSSATSGLIGFGIWIVVGLFSPLLSTYLKNTFANAENATTAEGQLAAINLGQIIDGFSPRLLYEWISTIVLRPDIPSGVPRTISEATQASQRISSVASLDQSLLIVWPQVIALITVTVILFAAAYILFMRQEVRA